MLILSAHHSICDGMSLAFAIRDVLQALAGSDLDGLSLHSSQEDALGMLPQPRSIRLNAKPQIQRPDAPSVFRVVTSTVPSVTSLQLSEFLTKALRSRARQEKTTVHAALVAAAGIAIRNTPDRASGRDLHICSTINNRKLMGSPEACGLLFTASDFVLADTLLDDFWSLARKSKDVLRLGQSEEGVRGILGAVDGIVQSGLDSYSAAEEGGKLFSFDLHVSNLGAVPVDTYYGALELRDLWGPAVLVGFEGEQVLGVSTVNEQLCLLHTSHRPLPGFLKKIESILKLACTS